MSEKFSSPPSSERSFVKTVHQDGTVTLVDPLAMGGDLDEMPEGYFCSAQFIGTVIAVCSASICAYLGWVLPANTLSLINEDIGPSPNINWVATVWSLGTAVGFLLVGRLSDIFGRKWMVMGTSGLGLVGNLLGATAGSVNVLIGSSICNGLAASGQLSFGIVLGELVPNKYRGPMMTLVFLSSLPFAVFGPVIARTFIIHSASGWRWSYYLGIIMSCVALVLYQFMYHPPTYTQLHVKGKTKRQQLGELDYGGMALFTAGMVLFLISLSWGGTTYAWESVQVLSTLILGVLTLTAFILYEGYVVRQNALIPLYLFKNSGYNAIVGCATIGAMVYYSLSILWPTIIQQVFTTSSFSIGLQSSVIGGGTLLGQMLAGVSITYLPKVKYQTISASCVALTFVTALASLSADGGHARFLTFGVLATCAIGFVDNITFPGVTLVIEPQDIGLASGVLGSIRAAGGGIAQALYTSVLNNKLAAYTPRYVTPAALGAGLPASAVPDLLAALKLGNVSGVQGMNEGVEMAVREGVRSAYVHAFRMVFWATVPFSAALVLAACFVPNMEGFLGRQVAKRLQGVVAGNGGGGGRTRVTGSEAVVTHEYLNTERKDVGEGV